MPPSPRHKARSRADILDAAGTLFRKHGYDGVGIDTLMEAAGLTRGTFYAHFSSKAALLVAVLEEPHALIESVEACTGGEEWQRERLKAALLDYVAPARLTLTRLECTLAALGVDAGREPEAQAAYAYQVDRLAAGLTRAGLSEAAAAELVTATVGTMTMARNLPEQKAGPYLAAAAARIEQHFAASVEADPFAKFAT